ncbi:MAG: hypothetical protein J5497_01880 [Selenomonadaceae bacterium]|nr:hypothetical protein [Selenomonadaceae bacterium]
MRKKIEISRFDAIELLRLSNEFYYAEQRWKDAANRADKLSKPYFQARDEQHLADLDRLSAGRAMSEKLYKVLNYYLDPLND